MHTHSTSCRSLMARFVSANRLHLLRLSLAGFLLSLTASQSATAATIGFNGTAAGPFDYNTTANWVGGTINGVWDTTLTLSAAQTVTFAADTVLTTGLTFNYAGSFALTIDSSSTTTRNVTLGGDINLNTGGTTANVTIGNSSNHLSLNLGAATRTMTVADNRTLSILDVVSNGGIAKSGNGTLTLSGTNTYASGTTISAGTVKVGGAAALGANGGAVSVTSGAALDINGITMTNTNALTLNGAGISSGGALKNSSATAGVYAGLLTLGSASSVIAGSGDITLSNTGTITGSGLGLTIGGAKNTTIAGIIGTGTGSLTKQDGGTLTLTATNTYTGATSVNAGTLNLSGSLGNTATTVAAGAFLAGEGSIGATGSLTFNDGASLRVDGGTAGALTVGSGATGDLVFNGNTTVVLDAVPAAMSAGTNTLRVLNYNGALTGTEANLALQNAANYRNPVFSTATAKQVNLSIDSKALTWSGASGAWDINAAANWNSGNDTFFQGDAVTFDDTGTTKAVTINGTVQPTSVAFNNSTGNDYSVAGVIGGATALSKSGTGNLTLSGANTYTGNTTVNAGTLTLNGTSSTATGAVSIASGAVLEIQKEQAFTSAASVTLSGNGTIRITGALVTTLAAGPMVFNLGSGSLIDVQAGTYNAGFGSNKVYTNNKADINVAAGASFGTSNAVVRVDAMTGLGTINASSGFLTGGSVTFGVDNGSGDFGGSLQTVGNNKFPFTKLGTGTQTLSGNNTYTSTMNVNAGVLALSGNGTLGAGTAPLAMGGGQLDLGGLSRSVGNVTVTAAFGSGDTIRNGNLTCAGTLYTVSNTTGNATISANLLGSGVALTKSGAGTLILSGTNTFNGTTTVSNSGGVLQIDSAAALPSGSTILLAKSSTGTGTLKLNTGGTNTYGNAFASFNSSLGSAGGGPPNIENLQGDNTISGNMNIGNTGGNGVNLQSDAGVLRISGTLTNTASGYRVFDFSGSGSGVFSGRANDTNGTTGVSLVKNGSGTWSFTGTTGNFTGGVSILQGVLNVASVANTGINSAIGAGGAINLTGQGTSGTLQYTGSSAMTTNHALTVAATGGTLDASGTSGGPLQFTGNVTAVDPSAFNFTYTTGSNVVTNLASNSPGTVAGNVMSMNATAIPAGTTITSINGNSYTLSQAATANGTLSTTFGANVTRTLTLTGTNADNNEITGNMSNSAGGGVLGVAKSGPGTWVLSGANTYTGNTTVSAGTLLISSAGSLASGSTVAVNAGTFGGAGTVNGPVIVAGGTTLQAGMSLVDSVQFNLTNNLSLATGSIVSLGLGAGGAHDTFNLTGGTVTFDPAQSFSFLDQGASPGVYSNIIIGLVSTPVVTGWTVANAGWTGEFSLNGNNVDFTLTAVPEPGTWILVGIGLTFLLHRKRRRLDS